MKPKDFVLSLARGLAVIEAFSEERTALTVSAIAVRAKISRAAARRLLKTLEFLGYVSSDGTHFSLKPTILKLGYAYISSRDVLDLAKPIMEKVVETCHMSCLAAVLDGFDVVYVSRVIARSYVNVSLPVGTMLPAYATSMGRVLLAWQPPQRIDGYLANVDLKRITRKTVASASRLRALLNKVREQGYCLVDGEVGENVISLAVPVFDRSGGVPLALNISGQSQAVSQDTMVREKLPIITAAAHELSSALRNL